MHAAQVCRSTSPAAGFGIKKAKVLDITPRTERAQAIARSREALFSCLRDLPEYSDYELSLTDLVEEDAHAGSDVIDSVVSCSPAPVKISTTTAAGAVDGVPLPRGGGAGAATKGRKKKRLRSSSSGRGILLNVYLPMTLAQSPSAGRRAGGIPHGREKMDFSSGKRDPEPSFRGCCGVLWQKKKRDGRLMGLTICEGPRRGPAHIIPLDKNLKTCLPLH